MPSFSVKRAYGTFSVYNDGQVIAENCDLEWTILPFIHNSSKTLCFLFTITPIIKTKALVIDSTG